MDGDIGSLLEEIRENGKFCVWRFENVGERKSKVPYNPITGEKAKSNDPESFAGFEQVISTKGYDGIGIGIFDGFCAIDLDHCIVNGTLTSAHQTSSTQWKATQRSAPAEMASISCFGSMDIILILANSIL